MNTRRRLAFDIQASDSDEEESSSDNYAEFVETNPHRIAELIFENEDDTFANPFINVTRDSLLKFLNPPLINKYDDYELGELMDEIEISKNHHFPVYHMDLNEENFSQIKNYPFQTRVQFLQRMIPNAEEYVEWFRNHKDVYSLTVNEEEYLYIIIDKIYRSGQRLSKNIRTLYTAIPPEYYDTIPYMAEMEDLLFHRNRFDFYKYRDAMLPRMNIDENDVIRAIENEDVDITHFPYRILRKIVNGNLKLPILLTSTKFVTSNDGRMLANLDDLLQILKLYDSGLDWESLMHNLYKMISNPRQSLETLEKYIPIILHLQSLGIDVCNEDDLDILNAFNSHSLRLSRSLRRNVSNSRKNLRKYYRRIYSKVLQLDCISQNTEVYRKIPAEMKKQFLLQQASEFFKHIQRRPTKKELTELVRKRLNITGLSLPILQADIETIIDY